MDMLKKRKIYLLFIVMFAVCSAFAFFSANLFSVRASTPIEPLFVMPQTELEYYALSSPQDAYIGEDYSAIIQDNTTLTIYTKDTGFVNSTATFDSLKQVRKWGDNGILVLDNTQLRCIDINNINNPYFIQNFPEENNRISANYLDLNDNYLITGFGQKIYVYKLNGTTGVERTEIQDADADMPLCINPDNIIIYVSNADMLCAKHANNVNAEAIELCNVSPDNFPDKLVADSEWIYFIQSGEIKRLPLPKRGETPETLLAPETLLVPETLRVIEDSNFTLGNLSSPSSISLYNGNLLITDKAINAVQEFKVTSYTDNNETKNGIQFTGFAIAKNKTAFNRSETTNKAIELCNNKLGILTENELFFYDTTKDTFDRTAFKHVKLGGFNANLLALGKNSALVADGANKTIKLLDLNTLQYSESLIMQGNSTPITSVAYQGGKYYIAKLDYSTELEKNVLDVYTYTEGETLALTKTLTIQDTYHSFDATSCMTVDLFGNIFISDKDHKIYKFAFDGENYAERASIQNLNVRDVVKLSTDLGGNLFVITNDMVVCHNGQTSESFHVYLTENNNPLIPKGLALSFENSTVYLVGENCEIIFQSTSLPNLAITEVAIPNNYVLSGPVTDIANLKLYNVKPNANVYSVSENENQLFIYNGLISTTENYSYLYICDANVSKMNGFTSADLSVIISINNGNHQTMLVSKNDIVLVDNFINNATISKAYIATDVNAYYLPVITLENTLTLTRNDQTLRLAHGTKFTPLKTLSLFDKNFYYATINLGSESINTYIPVDFTTTELSTEDNRVKFTIEKATTTDVYSSATLTTKIDTIEDGTTIRIYSVEDGVAKIDYKVGDAWFNGFMNAENIQPHTSNALRNTLIILSVSLAVCSTLIYFVLRKAPKRK